MQDSGNLSRLESAHGRLQKISTVDHDADKDVYECVLTFADGEKFMVWWTLDQINAAQRSDKRFTAAAAQTPRLASFSAQVDANRASRRTFQPNKMPQESLSQYASRNTQRTPLCNGRLYTRDVLSTISQSSLPEPFK